MAAMMLMLINFNTAEMAAMMLMLITFNTALLKLISINIIAAISWPLLLTCFTTFLPRLFKATSFFTAWLFLCGYHFFL